jgi:quercetin dioxygenase-like cupin family protein
MVGTKTTVFSQRTSSFYGLNRGEIETMDPTRLRFVTQGEIQVEESPWGLHEWLGRPGQVEAERLQMVRVHMPPGKGHAFHRHPAMEEIIYVLEGEAEQWVDRQFRRLGPGEIAHIPSNVVHATYNGGEDFLRFLAILSPAKFDGPALVDVSQEEPWRQLRPSSGGP